MRGVWKPALVWTSFALTFQAIFVLGARSRPALSDLVGGTVAMLVLGALFIVLGLLPPSRYLAGLRAAGVSVEVREDDVNWNGSRRVKGTSPRGDWSVRTEMGRFRTIYARGPGARVEERVRFSAYRAGKRAIEPRDARRPR